MIWMEMEWLKYWQFMVVMKCQTHVRKITKFFIKVLKIFFDTLNSFERENVWKDYYIWWSQWKRASMDADSWQKRKLLSTSSYHLVGWWTICYFWNRWKPQVIHCMKIVFFTNFNFTLFSDLDHFMLFHWQIYTSGKYQRYAFDWGSEVPVCSFVCTHYACFLLVICKRYTHKRQTVDRHLHFFILRLCIEDNRYSWIWLSRSSGSQIWRSLLVPRFIVRFKRMWLVSERKRKRDYSRIIPK